MPLAAVTVRASDCTILSICDWTPLRKHVVTTKTLGYWFGWLPFAPLIRQFMLEACCSTFHLRERGFYPTYDAASRQAAAAPQTTARTTFMDEPISLSTTTYRASNPMTMSEFMDLEDTWSTAAGSSLVSSR